MQELSPINYSARRERAFELIPNAALLQLAIPTALRNSDQDHPFRQDSLLDYLCGFHEPESAILMINDGKGSKKTYMFLRPRDREAELWTGRRLGIEDAVTSLGVDAAFPFDQIWKELPKLIKGVGRVYYTLGVSKEWDSDLVMALWKEFRLRGRHSIAARLPIFDAYEIAGKLRLVKEPDEIARMKAAAAITAKAFSVVYRDLRPGMNERTAHGMLVGEFLKHGAEAEAYNSIVAAGANACCLHYHSNCDPLRDGELLLIDAGCQYQYYASDVTRTFPIGKRFSSAQKSVYQMVLDIQKMGISLAVPGQTMQFIHEETCRAMTKGLMELGLLKGSFDELHEKKAFRKYYPHGTGHWLGLDVHDVGNYSDADGETKLTPGMVFTVEPGIYIDPNDQDAPAEFRGIGVRIEDDILVTAGKPEVLTAAIAKEVSDLEDRY